MPQVTTTLGADPEFFMIEENSMNLVNAVDFIDGSKEAPIKLHDALAEGYNYHRDNVMLELGIPVCKDPYQFSDAVSTAMSYANDMLQRKSAENDEYVQIYRNVCSVEMEDDDLTDPRAREFGCEPDQDAYEGGVQRVTADDMMGNHRTAGGHIHIGHGGEGFNCPNFIVALLCDAYIGCFASVEYTRTRQEAEAPYRWYRRPGLYRDKPYGIEYRSPSNQWTFNNNTIFRTAQRAHAIGTYCQAASATKIRKLIEKIDWLYVRNKILTGASDAGPQSLHATVMRDITRYGGE